MVVVIVNERQVSPNTVLYNKDRVRIITNVMSYGPKKMASEVQTTKAKKIIKEFKEIRYKNEYRRNNK